MPGPSKFRNVKIPRGDIEAFIPQRPPFVMVDELLNADSSRFETAFLVVPDNIFLEGDVLREFALIENIAQSAAAGLGYLHRAATAMPPEGFIGAISRLTVHDLPSVHETVHTVVTRLLQLDDMYLLRGENFANGRRLLECEVKIVGHKSSRETH